MMFYKHFAPLGLAPSGIWVYFSTSWVFLWHLKKNQKRFENAHSPRRNCYLGLFFYELGFSMALEEKSETL
ncbi:hypothetical protein C6496_16380 [Candidatus Poribacteria bacterium]|nr:MAG: hypothetical protein C6496_16380 [Candidatus Poribacteria bacterium]